MLAMNHPRPIRLHAAFAFRAALLGIACSLSACGVANTNFPNRLIGSHGEEIVLDDVEAIVNDDELTDDEKRDELRDLGIEDELLIDALLTL